MVTLSSVADLAALLQIREEEGCLAVTNCGLLEYLIELVDYCSDSRLSGSQTSVSCGCALGQSYGSQISNFQHFVHLELKSNC